VVLMPGRGIGRRDESGAVAVVAAVFISVVALVLTSLVVDVGYAKGQRRQAQAAADAAALAGADEIVATLRRGVIQAQNLRTATSRTAIEKAVTGSAQANWGTTPAEWTGCSAVPLLTGYERLVPTDPNDCIAVNWTTHRIRVRIPARTMPSFFNKKSLRTGATAQAAWSETLPACGLCVLGDAPHSIGNGNVLVSDANVSFNGSVTTNGNNGSVSVSSGQLNIENSAGSSGNLNPAPNYTGTPIADPLGSFQMPTLPTSAPTGASPCTAGPGVYGDWQNFSGCVLQPGLYVVTGQWKMASTGEHMFGSGVTLYFTCATSSGAPRVCNSAGESGGALQQNGGTLELSAPVAPSPTAGLLIMYDRNNTASITLRGNGATTYSGTMYAPSSTLDINGTTGAATVDSLIVVNDLALSSQNGYVRTTYTQGNNMSVPGGVYLDE
jgi:Putative Flp pilus-assembly TadE/G-like